MQINISRNYSVEFTDEEVVDALCYFLSHVRSTTETAQVASLMRNADGGIKVVSRESGLALKFSYTDKPENEK